MTEVRVPHVHGEECLGVPIASARRARGDDAHVVAQLPGVAALGRRVPAVAQALPLPRVEGVGYAVARLSRRRRLPFCDGIQPRADRLESPEAARQGAAVFGAAIASLSLNIKARDANPRPSTTTIDAPAIVRACGTFVALSSPS